MNTQTWFVYSVVMLASLLIVVGCIVVGTWRSAAVAQLSTVQAQRITISVALGLLGWLALSSLLAARGFYTGTIGERVPRIAIGIVLPLLGALLALNRSSGLRQIVAATPLHWLIGLQFYRLGALTFLTLYLQAYAPVGMAFVAIGDMLVAVAAVVVAALVRRGQRSAPQVAFWWALFAALDLAHGVFQVITGRNAVPSTALFAAFPFALIGSFTTPISLLLLGIIFARLRRQRSAPARAAFV
jgi:hypothetical protein